MASWVPSSQPESMSDIIQSHMCVWIGDDRYGGWKKELLLEELSPVDNILFLCGECGGIAREACTLIVGEDQSLRCSNCLPEQRPDVLIYPAKINRKALYDKHAMCPFPECKWSKEISLLEEHLGECEQLPAPCPLECRSEGDGGERITLIKRIHIDQHKKNECPMRPVNCEACKKLVKACEMNLHEQSCKFILISCPNGCKDRVSGINKLLKRNDLRFHINKECPLESVKCPYSEYGCTDRMKRMHLSQHNKDSVDKHFKLCQENNKQQIKMCMRKQDTMDKEITHLKSRISELELSNKSPPMFGMVEVQLENVQQKIQAKSDTYLPPFFVGKYKLQVCIDWDCCGNENIGCYVFIMQGDWDDSLVWPVRYKYTFTIVNQNKKDDYFKFHEITDNEMKKYASSFLKPKSDRNEGYGLREFISHTECLKYRHTQNDSLTFRAQIEIIPSGNLS